MIKKCLTKGEMTKVNKAVDKRKPATRKDQRFAKKQEEMFRKLDDQFIKGIDNLDKKAKITAIQSELKRKGVAVSRQKINRMLKGEVRISKPISKPIIPESLTAITPGASATPEAILNHYRVSANAAGAKGISASALKKQVAKILGEKMNSLKMPEWDKLVKYLKSKRKYLELPKGYDMNEWAASTLIEGWTVSSGDGIAECIAVQLAARAEFGLKGSSIWWQKRALKEATKIFKTHEVAMRRFLREMHNNTQKYLRSKGLKSIRVVRGYVGDIGIKISTPLNPMTTIKIKLQPMSSFSSKFRVAEDFAKVSFESESLIFAEVPANRVLSCPVTGFGCKNEFEWVILGATKEAETMLASRIGLHLGRWNYIFPGRSWINKLIEIISGKIKK